VSSKTSGRLVKKRVRCSNIKSFKKLKTWIISPRKLLLSKRGYCVMDKSWIASWISLELRLLRYELLLRNKIVFGLIDRAVINMFTLTSSLHSVTTRGHSSKLYPHNSSIDIRKCFLAEWVVTLWKNLPATNDHFPSLSTFKRLVNSNNLSV
jgi:hypothetical protein